MSQTGKVKFFNGQKSSKKIFFQDMQIKGFIYLLGISVTVSSYSSYFLQLHTLFLRSFNTISISLFMSTTLDIIVLGKRGAGFFLGGREEDAEEAAMPGRGLLVAPTPPR